MTRVDFNTHVTTHLLLHSWLSVYVAVDNLVIGVLNIYFQFNNPNYFSCSKKTILHLSSIFSETSICEYAINYLREKVR